MTGKSDEQELADLIRALRHVSLILTFAFSQEKLDAVPDVDGPIREAMESNSRELALALLRDTMRHILCRAVACEKHQLFSLPDGQSGTLTQAFQASQLPTEKELLAALRWICERAQGMR